MAFRDTSVISALGPHLFNIFIKDFFYLTEMTDVCNYADDKTFLLATWVLKVLLLDWSMMRPLL